jgi:ATP-dependent DNA ligase
METSGVAGGAPGWRDDSRQETRETGSGYDRRVIEPTSPRDIAAAWEPQRPGRRATRDIPDAIVEPAWGGLRAAAVLGAGPAALFAHGSEITVPNELLDALRGAFTALDAVVEGNVTTKALHGSEGMLPPAAAAERPPILVPRALLKSVKDDPFVRARDHVREAEAAEATILEALADGERHAFVATDLLWVDGQSLLDVPLLERKRQLDTILEESFLVRITTFVRPSAVLTLVTWGGLGFEELSYRASNSRYLPGRENPDWAVARPPEGPHGPAKAPAPPR